MKTYRQTRPIHKFSRFVWSIFNDFLSHRGYWLDKKKVGKWEDDDGSLIR